MHKTRNINKEETKGNQVIESNVQVFFERFYGHWLQFT